MRARAPYSHDVTQESRHGGHLVHVGAHDGVDKAEVGAGLEGLVSLQCQLGHRLPGPIDSSYAAALPELGEDEGVICREGQGGT